MPFDSDFGRQSLADWADFYGKGAEESGQAQALERQLSSEHNIVLFSGQRLIRSISRYSWNAGTGFVDPIENPYHGVTATELENVRLDERRTRGLRLEDAVVLGLLSDEEIDEAFEPEYLWVSSGRSAQGHGAVGAQELVGPEPR
jgi:hypothetical protein